MTRPDLDLSLYLVTGRELLPPNKDYYKSLEEAITGGVTVVQVREKNAETGEFLEIATRTKEICQKHKIPILINDRIDIALAMGADGVHLGQTDMPISLARKLLPKDAIIGISVHNPEQAKQVKEEGLADYVGIGPIWPTTSKNVSSPILGPRGVGPILDKVDGSNIKSVAIGGLNLSNALRTLHGAVGIESGRSLDGLAVISAIVASNDPTLAAQLLKQSISPILYSMSNPIEYGHPYAVSVIKAAHQLFTRIKDAAYTPLIHQITNNVTINQLANATIAIGASPIMATAAEEMEDLSKLPGALLLNMGTIKDKASMLLAGRFANIARKPVIFDPVGIGATQFRKNVGDELLNHLQATIIKGNAGEIAALAKSEEVTSRGVDSGGGGFSDPAMIVTNLARRERCIVIMTGVRDYISDGQIAFEVSNGHELLGSFSGSGCMLGAIVASFCGVASMEWKESQDLSLAETQLAPGNMLAAALAGVLAMNLAAENAAKCAQGPGTFLPHLIDGLSKLSPSELEGAHISIIAQK